MHSDLSCGEPSMSLPLACTEKASAAATSKKRAVTVKTVQNWISQYDKELGTVVWLKYDTTGRTNV